MEIMARKHNALTARTVESLAAPGRYGDGGNLYLSIAKDGRKRWVFMYRLQGRQRELGLGSANKLGTSLADARRKAAEARKSLEDGIDPIVARQTAQLASKAIPTFKAFATEYIANHEHGWRNDKHIAQWKMTIEQYCKPIHNLPLNAIDTEAVLRVLQPIWQSKAETASRLRGRIENILDAAKARGFAKTENPARWRGHLKALLPARQRLTRGHHAAMSYDDVPAFIGVLRHQKSHAALALELTILTVCRTSEVLNAGWSEFDLQKAIWTIPATRMKAGHEHRVPLTKRALAILNAMKAYQRNGYVFPGTQSSKPLSTMAMAMLLRRMKRANITVHGFRSSFRDWASEQTSFPHETCEHALAHRISDKAEAAYRRGDQFEKRRKLMEAWGSFMDGASSIRLVADARNPSKAK
jgi:integrase